MNSPLNPRYVQAIVAYFAPRVAAELDRIEAESRAALPGCMTYRHAYTADTYLDMKTTWREDRLSLGFVQTRTVLGTIHSATVFADLGTGEVWVEGWPLPD